MDLVNVEFHCRASPDSIPLVLPVPANGSASSASCPLLLQIPGSELKRHFDLDVSAPITYSPCDEVASVIPLPPDDVAVLFRVPPEGFPSRVYLSGTIEYVV